MSNLRNLCIKIDPSHSDQYTTMMVIQSLTQSFQNAPEEAFLRYQLILVLAQINHKMIQMFFMMQLRNIYEKDEMVRAALAEALAVGCEDERTLEFLTDFGDDESEFVRECVRFAVERADVSQV